MISIASDIFNKAAAASLTIDEVTWDTLAVVSNGAVISESVTLEWLRSRVDVCDSIASNGTTSSVMKTALFNCLQIHISSRNIVSKALEHLQNVQILTPDGINGADLQANRGVILEILSIWKSSVDIQKSCYELFLLLVKIPEFYSLFFLEHKIDVSISEVLSNNFHSIPLQVVGLNLFSDILVCCSPSDLVVIANNILPVVFKNLQFNKTEFSTTIFCFTIIEFIVMRVPDVFHSFIIETAKSLQYFIVYKLPPNSLPSLPAAISSPSPLKKLQMPIEIKNPLRLLIMSVKILNNLPNELFVRILKNIVLSLDEEMNEFCRIIFLQTSINELYPVPSSNYEEDDDDVVNVFVNRCEFSRQFLQIFNKCCLDNSIAMSVFEDEESKLTIFTSLNEFIETAWGVDQENRFVSTNVAARPKVSNDLFRQIETFHSIYASCVQSQLRKKDKYVSRSSSTDSINSTVLDSASETDGSRLSPMEVSNSQPAIDTDRVRERAKEIEREKERLQKLESSRIAAEKVEREKEKEKEREIEKEKEKELKRIRIVEEFEREREKESREIESANRKTLEANYANGLLQTEKEKKISHESASASIPTPTSTPTVIVATAIIAHTVSNAPKDGMTDIKSAVEDPIPADGKVEFNDGVSKRRLSHLTSPGHDKGISAVDASVSTFSTSDINNINDDNIYNYDSNDNNNNSSPRDNKAPSTPASSRGSSLAATPIAAQFTPPFASSNYDSSSISTIHMSSGPREERSCSTCEEYKQKQERMDFKITALSEKLNKLLDNQNQNKVDFNKVGSIQSKLNKLKGSLNDSKNSSYDSDASDSSDDSLQAILSIADHKKHSKVDQLVGTDPNPDSNPNPNLSIDGDLDILQNTAVSAVLVAVQEFVSSFAKLKSDIGEATFLDGFPANSPASVLIDLCDLFYRYFHFEINRFKVPTDKRRNYNSNNTAINDSYVNKISESAVQRCLKQILLDNANKAAAEKDNEMGLKRVDFLILNNVSRKVNYFEFVYSIMQFSFSILSGKPLMFVISHLKTLFQNMLKLHTLDVSSIEVDMGPEVYLCVESEKRLLTEIYCGYSSKGIKSLDKDKRGGGSSNTFGGDWRQTDSAYSISSDRNSKDSPTLRKINVSLLSSGSTISKLKVDVTSSCMSVRGSAPEKSANKSISADIRGLSIEMLIQFLKDAQLYPAEFSLNKIKQVWEHVVYNYKEFEDSSGATTRRNTYFQRYLTYNQFLHALVCFSQLCPINNDPKEGGSSVVKQVTDMLMWIEMCTNLSLLTKIRTSTGMMTGQFLHASSTSKESFRDIDDKKILLDIASSSCISDVTISGTSQFSKSKNEILIAKTKLFHG